MIGYYDAGTVGCVSCKYSCVYDYIEEVVEIVERKCGTRPNTIHLGISAYHLFDGTEFFHDWNLVLADLPNNSAVLIADRTRPEGMARITLCEQ